MKISRKQKHSNGYAGMMSIRWFIALIILLGILLAVGIFLVLRQNIPLSPTANESVAEWTYKLAQISIIILGVLTGAGAAAVGYRNQRVKESQVDSKFTERFSQAVEHLGSSEVAVRIGGVYALERLARDSRSDRNHIVEVLCSHYHEKSSKNTEESDSTEGDIRAIRRVLPRLLRQYGGLEPDLSGMDLGGLSFSECHLRGANFSHANLKKTELLGVNLQNANLSFADLQEVWLFDANLQGANLCSADLQGAYLYMANLQEADLLFADLSMAILQKANLFNASLQGVYLQGADLTNAFYGKNILAAKWDESTIFSNGVKGIPDVTPHSSASNSSPSSSS